VTSDQEAGVGIGILVDADGQDGEIGALMVELDEGRHLLNAGGAPSGPEVHQDHLSTIAGQMHGGGAVGDGEVGGALAHLGGMGAAIAAGREGQRHEQN
jgi:hypothetical protein